MISMINLFAAFFQRKFEREFEKEKNRKATKAQRYVKLHKLERKTRNKLDDNRKGPHVFLVREFQKFLENSG